MYPFNLRIEGQKLLFAGGGAVAERKVLSILGEKPLITLIAPAITPHLKKLAEEKQIEYIARGVLPEDVTGAWKIIFACTDNPAVNSMIAQRADEMGIWANIADSPERSTLYMPAVAYHEGLTIAVSTGGIDPSRAKRVKEKLTDFFQSLSGKL